MHVLPTWICACAWIWVHAWCPWRPEDGVRYPGTGVTDSCNRPWRCWGLNLVPLKEQPVILTTESSLQPQTSCLNLRLEYLDGMEIKYMISLRKSVSVLNQWHTRGETHPVLLFQLISLLWGLRLTLQRSPSSRSMYVFLGNCRLETGALIS